MLVRSESVLALLPPAIALSWVVADATMGLVAADRDIHQFQPVVQIVDQVETASAVDAGQPPETLVFCSTGNAVAAGTVKAHSHGRSQATLTRLCRAGWKFTTSLPKS